MKRNQLTAAAAACAVLLGGTAYLPEAALTVQAEVTAASAYYDWNYETYDDYAEITKYIGSDAEVTVPDELGGLPVTSIAKYAFQNRSSLTSVTLPDTLTSIGIGAFWKCDNMTSVYIPESVTSIDEAAFFGCSALKSVAIPDGITAISGRTFFECTALTAAEIPESVTSIGDSAFWGCSGLTEISIPNGVTSIGYGAFLGCSGLKTVSVSESVTSIANSVFQSCDSLTAFEVAAQNPVYSSADGVLMQGTTLLQYPVGNPRSSYTVPDGITRIGNYAFERAANLTDIVLPESVTEIGFDAFSDTPWLDAQLEAAPFAVANNILFACDQDACAGDVVLPDGITSIGDGALRWNWDMESVTIPEGVTSIGDSAFYECEWLQEVTLPSTLVSIGTNAFGCVYGLSQVTIPKSVKYIGAWAFDCYYLEDVYYPGSHEEWGEIEMEEDAFHFYNVTVHFGNNGQLIGDINGDDEVSIADAVLLSRILAEDTTVEETAFPSADFDHDGLLTLFDVHVLLHWLRIR